MPTGVVLPPRDPLSSEVKAKATLNVSGSMRSSLKGVYMRIYSCVCVKKGGERLVAMGGGFAPMPSVTGAHMSSLYSSTCGRYVDMEGGGCSIHWADSAVTGLFVAVSVILSDNGNKNAPFGILKVYHE